MGAKKAIAAFKDIGIRLLAVLLAAVLVLIVASRNVEYNLEQQAQSEQEQAQTSPYPG